ncbi:MAG: hypothetical protein ACRCV9_18510 [Burkholderiaceae bacterium]
MSELRIDNAFTQVAQSLSSMDTFDSGGDFGFSGQYSERSKLPSFSAGFSAGVAPAFSARDSKNSPLASFDASLSLPGFGHSERVSAAAFDGPIKGFDSTKLYTDLSTDHSSGSEQPPAFGLGTNIVAGSLATGAGNFSQSDPPNPLTAPAPSIMLQNTNPIPETLPNFAPLSDDWVSTNNALVGPWNPLQFVKNGAASQVGQEEIVKTNNIQRDITAKLSGMQEALLIYGNTQHGSIQQSRVGDATNFQIALDEHFNLTQDSIIANQNSSLRQQTDVANETLTLEHERQQERLTRSTQIRIGNAASTRGIEIAIENDGMNLLVGRENEPRGQVAQDVVPKLQGLPIDQTQVQFFKNQLQQKIVDYTTILPPNRLVAPQIPYTYNVPERDTASVGNGLLPAPDFEADSIPKIPMTSPESIKREADNRYDERIRLAVATGLTVSPFANTVRNYANLVPFFSQISSIGVNPDQGMTNRMLIEQTNLTPYSLARSINTARLNIESSANLQFRNLDLTRYNVAAGAAMVFDANRKINDIAIGGSAERTAATVNLQNKVRQVNDEFRQQTADANDDLRWKILQGQEHADNTPGANSNPLAQGYMSTVALGLGELEKQGQISAYPFLNNMFNAGVATGFNDGATWSLLRDYWSPELINQAYAAGEKRINRPPTPLSGNVGSLNDLEAGNDVARRDFFNNPDSALLKPRDKYNMVLDAQQRGIYVPPNVYDYLEQRGYKFGSE